MTHHCCEAMTSRVNVDCDQHDTPFACPDALVDFSAKFQEYGLIIHDGGRSSITINFCPWCGRRLPESQRDRWFHELERRSIDPWEDEVPAEFQDDRWLAYALIEEGLALQTIFNPQGMDGEMMYGRAAEPDVAATDGVDQF